jgi:hypothetical protein
MSLRRAASLAGACLLLAASSGFGATDAASAPAGEDAVPWIAILYSLVGLAGICVVAFKNAKRSAVG